MIRLYLLQTETTKSRSNHGGIDDIKEIGLRVEALLWLISNCLNALIKYGGDLFADQLEFKRVRADSKSDLT